MITLRRAGARRHDRRREQQVWLTFDAQDRTDPLADGFGALEGLDEDRLSPGAELPRRTRRDAEIITYVCRGALACDGSTGRSGVLQAGEFQRTTPGLDVRHAETNASRTDWAHVFRLWLRPFEAQLDPGREQKRFSTAERRNGLYVVASPDARRGSLHLHQDAVVYSALLGPGSHVVHALGEGRGAWLHLVEGELTLGSVILVSGDGAGLTAERVVSFTAREETEILLVDLGAERPRSHNPGGVP